MMACEEPGTWIVIPVTRELFPRLSLCPTLIGACPLATLLVMVVTSMPAPWSVMFLPLMFTSEAPQVQAPGGRTTVSPVTAVLIADCTSDAEQVPAAIVAAWLGKAVLARITILTMRISNLHIENLLHLQK